jgi:acetyl esterase/lipase
MVGEGAVRSMDDVVKRWSRAGWVVLNSDYRPGAASVHDARASWDALREAVGADVPMALHGKSAGGHLALMTASSRSDVALVVGESAPTSLANLGGTRAARGVRKTAKEIWGKGPGGLDAVSPAHPSNSSKISAPILLSAARHDQVVPARQMRYMQTARPDLVQALTLEPGSTPFIHADVSQESFEHYLAVENVYRLSAAAARVRQ